MKNGNVVKHQKSGSEGLVSNSRRATVPAIKICSFREQTGPAKVKFENPPPLFTLPGFFEFNSRIQAVAKKLWSTEKGGEKIQMCRNVYPLD